MKSNLELAREAGMQQVGDRFIANERDLNVLAALIEQRYRERLLGVKVEPVAWLSPIGHIHREAPTASMKPLHTAEQCAAMVAQAMPKRLSREQVDAALDAASISLHRFADAIQDALGVKEPKP